MVANPIAGLVSIGSDSKVTTRSDFENLSSQIAKVTPSAVNSASYSPSNSPQACPTENQSWEAVPSLPPSPNTAVCSCMVSNLTCVAKSTLSDDAIQSQFAYICSPTLGHNCLGVTANGTTGIYGAYSMCNATQRLSYAFNQYYLSQVASNTQNNDPCDFSGAAQKVSPKIASGCGAVISQAGSAGTGVITNAPTATGGSSGSGSTSTSKAAAGVVSVPALDFGMIKLAAYVSTAVLVGAGLVMI